MTLASLISAPVTNTIVVRGIARRSRLRRVTVKRCANRRCDRPFPAGRGVLECVPWAADVERYCSTPCLDRALTPGAAA